MAEQARPGETVRLGHVTVPSGVVLVIDTGLLHFWSHDRKPVMPEWAADEQTVAAANGQVDFRIDGPDAEKAGRLFDRQWNPFYLFDIPPHGVDPIRTSFRKCIEEHGLDARLVQLDRRISHRERIDLMLKTAPAGEVQFQGLWACAVSGVPAGGKLEVFGEHMPEEPYSHRWRSVWLECRPGAEVAHSERAGYVMVEEARLMFADVDALGAWKQDEPLDGKADFVFWGRDAREAAAHTDAEQLSEDQWGWRDLPVREAAEKAEEFEQLCADNDWKMARDFRPHSHHHAVMSLVRASATDSGTITVGGASMTTFMTRWGDGIYPVLRELDAEGRLVRIRVDLGNEDTVKRMQAVEERYFGALAKCALVSRRVAGDGHPVCWLYREEPDNDHDSGWRVFAGDEDEDYLDDIDNCEVVPLRDLVDRDGVMEEVLRAPVFSAFERKGPDDPFEVVEGFFDEDEEAEEDKEDSE
jgi:hypothetical protein